MSTDHQQGTARLMETESHGGIHGTIIGMAEQANPVFAVLAVVIPLGALVYAVEWAPLQHHVYVHVMAGCSGRVSTCSSGWFSGR